MKICAISDTHNRHNQLKIPECDLLIHAGDWTSLGYKHEVQTFAKWLSKQTQCKEIIVIPGNHEQEFEKQLPLSLTWFKEKALNVHLLINEEITLFGKKIYGSPITPFFNNWAWNKHRGEEIKRYWNMIPDDVNILITHGPPFDILDKVVNTFMPLGCAQLHDRIKELNQLDLHFFGHIHSPGGQNIKNGRVTHYNAAMCNEEYKLTNKLTVIDYEID